AAVVLVDATKLRWQDALPALLPQTRRRSLLVKLLRVPSIVFAVNKLDAVDQPELAFAHIRAALLQFAEAAGIAVQAIVPVSALIGTNVVDAVLGWCDYHGPSLLQLLERLPATKSDSALPFSLSVQWVEKFSASNDTAQGRRIFWGCVATGVLRAGQRITVMPGGKSAIVVAVLNATRQPEAVVSGRSAGLILDRELDVSRGDWLLADEPDSTIAMQKDIRVTRAWLDDEALVPGRGYWALPAHRWVKAKVSRIVNQLDIHTLQANEADALPVNAIGELELSLLEALPVLPFAHSGVRGALVLIDPASHRTAGAVPVGAVAAETGLMPA
ncbi:MAG: sulfate adenylyltransferase, partial [Polaromonas sp.]|nr:sulfate adenylyltransferase [Polaromonas sp.]